jgi:hypothetical protein
LWREAILNDEVHRSNEAVVSAFSNSLTNFAVDDDLASIVANRLPLLVQ